LRNRFFRHSAEDRKLNQPLMEATRLARDAQQIALRKITQARAKFPRWSNFAVAMGVAMTFRRQMNRARMPSRDAAQRAGAQQARALRQATQIDKMLTRRRASRRD